MNRGEKWKEGKLKHLAVIRNGQDYKEVVSESGIYPVYGSGGVFAKATDFLYDGKSVLFGRKGTIDKPRLAAGRFWTVDTMFYSEIDRHACPEFVYYVATTIPYSLYSTSTALPSMTQDDLKNHAVLIPSFTEQRQIAAYLNRETAKIDKLIAKQQKLIKLLQEKRQAVISQAVTKGLAPNVKMKDSGVEGINFIPEHWKISKLKRVAISKIGLTYSPEDLVDEGCGTLVLRSGNIQNGKFEYKNNVYVKKFIPEKLIIRETDILVCTRNGSRSLIGKNAIAGSDDVGNSFGAFTTIIRSSMNEYLYWFLNSQIFKIKMGTFLTSTINQLTVENLGSIDVPVPPLEEQTLIIINLRKKVSFIDKSIEKASNAIDLMKEHRQVLITAAVTGKIDVRGLVSDEEVAALDAEPEVETTEEDLTSEVLEDTYITEEE